MLAMCLLFIPSRRYAVPVTLPFELDPYRLVLLLVFGTWLLSLLADPRLRPRSTGLEGPLALFVVAVVASLLANPDRVSFYQSEVVKGLSVLFSLLLTFYFTVSVLRRLDAVETALKTLVLGGAVVAVLAVIESRTGWSPFSHLERYLPLEPIQPVGLPGAEGPNIREGKLRALGSAEHPIALGALLALLAPIAVAFAVRLRSAIWWIAVAALVIGAVSTVSRTAIVMLIAAFTLFAILRWGEARRFVPLALVVIAFTHLVLPGALGSLRGGFKPSRIAAEARMHPESVTSAGRLADLGPSFDEFRQKPVLGYGPGTRIVVGERANARILDNQWLGSLLETGVVGVVALVWLLSRYISRLTRASAAAQPRDAVLLAALASSVFGFAVGMFLYDAFSFTQITLTFFLLLGAGSALALAPGRIFEALPEPIVAPERVRRARLRERIAAAARRRHVNVGAQLDRVRRYSVAPEKPPEDSEKQ